MPLDQNRLVLVAAGGSLALLLGAFAFQLLGYAPCAMCLWQRWPHTAAVLIGGLWFASKRDGLLWLGALAAGSTSAIGAYHAGVEQKWWPGPSTCTGASDALSGFSGADLLPGSATDAIVMCDEIVWDTWGLGITMAGWNFVISAVLVVVWIMAARARS